MAVEAESVDSIVMPPSHLTHPPGSSPARPGIFHHGGHVYALVDMHARLGLSGDFSQRGRLLLYHQGAAYHAQQVDEVIGLVQPEQDGQWGTLPPYLPRELFWGGLLYRDEILLCTALDKLRRMHDTMPLQRLLQKPSDTPAPQADIPTPVPPVAITPSDDAPPSPIHTVSAKPSATPAHRQDSPESRTHQPPAVSPAPRPQPSLGKRSEQRPAPPRPSVPPRSPAVATRKAAVPPVTPPRAQASPPPPPPVSPPAAPVRKAGGGLFWLLPVVMLLAAAWFGWQAWQLPEPGRPTSSTPVQPPVPPIVSAPVPAPRPSEPPPRAAPEPRPVSPPSAPHPEELAPPAAPEPVAETEELVNFTPRLAPLPEPEPIPPLTLEREADGTLHLIIDRQALLAELPLQQAIVEEQPSTAVPVYEDLAAAAVPPESPVADEPVTPLPDHTEAPALSLSPKVIPPKTDTSAWFDPQARPLEPCECVHLVVRGDTLWSIARRYTGNAYNYPLLARQSGIENPDRIYPGDRIRITIR